MKSQEPKEKKFRQLSDEELEKVTGGDAGSHFCGGALINDAHCIQTR